MILHIAHHKAMTQFVESVIKCANLNFYIGSSNTWPEGYDRWLCYGGSINELPPCRVSQIIRDPRDIMVSTYFYHLWSTEKWVRQPSAELDGDSLYKHLKERSKDHALKSVIIIMASRINMHNWIDDSRVISFRYEDVFGNENEKMGEIFKFWGLSEEETERAMCAVDKYKFTAITSGDGLHARRGTPGDWKNHLTSEHLALLDELMPGVVEGLGY
jgi:hypothetical protein